MSKISVSYESRMSRYFGTSYGTCILVVSLFKCVVGHFALKSHVSKLWLALL